ncbi:MAG: oxidoreductase [Proteobacteria bacterium]|nr:MAG: oxidoreductase [Pseudomonadota bacterium]
MNNTTGIDGFMDLTITRKVEIADGIWLFDLERPDGEPLPGFEPGAHLTVITPSGARRNYSLCNDPAVRGVYQLGIKAERDGRGASVSLVDETGVGDTLKVAGPDNTFPLVEADDYLFIAGGIGITPIMSMVRFLKRTGHDKFHLVYVTRNPDLTAFREELQSPDYEGFVEIHCDGGDPDAVYDFWPLFETPVKRHVYCCGPRPLMEEILGVSGHWSPEYIHFEDFASDVQAVRADDKAFSVRHADTGEVVEIPADATILETLRQRGHDLPSSCESGTCGTCRTELVEGVADHRDMVLEDHQRDKYIMICVSRAQSDELVLRW